jgi:predicted AAA+ superfamily ATPase
MNYLQSVVDTILWKDVAGRHEVRDRGMLVDMLALVAQSVGTRPSTRKISKVLGVSKETVSRTIHLFIEANLVHSIERHGKVSERKASPRKMYLADTGLFSVLTEDINLGSIVENAVYLALMRRDKVRYHFASGREVDFLSGGAAWESKYKTQLTDKDLGNIKRLRRPTRRVVVTKNAEGMEEGVELLPLWRFLTQEAETE